MSQTSEEIEAKLAAYIDGTLDDAGRAEIVKHLAANPSHARLLEDLARGREMLSSLPRETAPPEILEAIQSQLERRMLLDETAQQSAAAEARGSVWARRMALAAVLAMSATLVLVVYSVLPSPRDRSRELAELDRRAAAGHESTAGHAGDASASGPLAAAPAATASDVAPAPTAVATAADEVSRGLERVGALAERPITGVSGGRPAGDALVTAAATPAEVLVLLTDDRVSAESELRNVLLANRLEFEPIADASLVAATLDADRPPAGASFGAAVVDSTARAPVVAGSTVRADPFPPPATAPAVAQQPGKQPNEAVYFVRNVPRSQVRMLNDALQQQQQQTRRGQANFRQQVQQAVPPQQQELYNQLAQNVIKNKREQQYAGRQTAERGFDGVAKSADLGQSSDDRAYEQKQSAAGQRQQQYEPPPQQPAAQSPSEAIAAKGQAENEPHALPPSAGLIAAGEKLLVRISPPAPAGGAEQAGGSGVAGGGWGGPANLGGGEERVTVNDEGAIQLPGTPPVQALGLTPVELERRLADQLRDKDTPSPQVSVRRDVGGEETARRTREDVSSLPAAPTPPAAPDASRELSLGAAPTTGPAVADAMNIADASGVTDLVIVVRQEEAPPADPSGTAAPASSGVPSPPVDPAAAPATAAPGAEAPSAGRLPARPVEPPASQPASQPSP